MAGEADPVALQAYLAEDSSWFPFRCSIAAIVMVTVAYALRFWARSLQTAPWGWFDWFMIPAYIGNIGVGVCGILAVDADTGRHLEVLYLGPKETFDRWGLLTFYISGMIYYVGVTFPRLSILCLYYRLFQDKYSRAGIWLVVVLMLGRAVVETVILFLQCNRVSNTWHIEQWQEHCSFLLQHYTWSRIPNIAVDVIMLILPIPSLWRLPLSIDVKLGVVATFCLGSFGLITAIIGFVYFDQSMWSFDLSWIAAPMMAWSVLESAVYFTSACMLTYKPLVRSALNSRVSKSLFSRSSPNEGLPSFAPVSRSEIRVLREADTTVEEAKNFSLQQKEQHTPLPPNWKFRELPALPHEREGSEP